MTPSSSSLTSHLIERAVRESASSQEQVEKESLSAAHVTHLIERAVRESASSQEQVEKESLSAAHVTHLIGESREGERVITGTGGEGELECSHTSHTCWREP